MANVKKVDNPLKRQVKTTKNKPKTNLLGGVFFSNDFKGPKTPPKTGENKISNAV